MIGLTSEKSYSIGEEGHQRDLGVGGEDGVGTEGAARYKMVLVEGGMEI
jgi:hypothetical protein